MKDGKRNSLSVANKERFVRIYVITVSLFSQFYRYALNHIAN